MEAGTILAELNQQLSTKGSEHVQERIATYLNELLLHDFPSLVQLLYRVDVPEKKVTAVLRENPDTDAGMLLAGLLIQRLHEKQASRETFRFSSGASDEERW